MEFYWEGIKYEMVCETPMGEVITRTYFTEEDLAKAIEVYSDQVISFRKVIGGIIL